MKPSYRIVNELSQFDNPRQASFEEFNEFVKKYKLHEDDYKDVDFSPDPHLSNHSLITITFNSKEALLKYLYGKFDGDYIKARDELADHFGLYFSEKEYNEIKKIEEK